MPLAALPLPATLALAALVGLLLGAAVNWAAYWLAWNRRHVSPWSPPHEQAPPRRASDRIPLLGWWGLRREHPVHGRGFWVRPIAVELMMAVGVAALVWWEVDRLGLIRGQFAHLAGAWPPVAAMKVASSALWPAVIAHVVLLTLMAAASLIDIDEKLIPDEITVYGTLIGLALAAWTPFVLLPQVTDRQAPAEMGEPILLNLRGQWQHRGGDVEPSGHAAPAPLSEDRIKNKSPRDLAVALACYAVWCFALTPRIFRRRHGWRRGLAVLLARVRRELLRPPLLWLELGGAAMIVAAWLRGGPGWAGLYSALIGMLGGGALVWGVRIVGSWALQREAMGFGDVTLMMMIGAFVGWQACVFIFFAAPLAGLLVGVVQLVLRRGDEIPYGPFLCLATVAVVAAWAAIWSRFAVMFEIPWLVPAALGICLPVLGAMLVLWRNIKEAIFGPLEEDLR